jgi:hypothetical protein
MLTVIKYENANAIEATWFDSNNKAVRSIAYADVQMQLFRNDVAQYGGDISKWESLIAEVEANIQPTPEPAPYIPSIVSMRQARLALLQVGLLSTVSAAIAAGGEADQIEWEYAAEVNRNQPLVQNMKAGLGLSDTDLDNLFIMAASL